MFWHDFVGSLADLGIFCTAARSLSKTLQTGVSFCMGI